LSTRESILDENLLQSHADRGVRSIALSLLADAKKATAKLLHSSKGLGAGHKKSDDALHDFRVAVRRLRSWIRAFKPHLRDAVSRKQRRRLSDIADATGAIRDATVHLEWLHSERRAMGVRQRVGEAWLRKRLEQQRDDSVDAALKAASDFDAMAAKLERRLSVYRVEVIEREPAPKFGVVLAECILKESTELKAHLAAIHAYTDGEEAHRARIAAKRLRYVLEPVSELFANGDEIIDTLKALQDSLGDLHDVHVFCAEVTKAAEEHVSSPECAGLLRLARRLNERGARAYAVVDRNWLNDGGAAFFDRVRDLAADIERRATADATSRRGP
jgi:CHAD domain-containing protein